MPETYPIINGFQLTEDWHTSGDCQWSYAVRDGKTWFIKQYMAPKYKSLSDGCSQRQVDNSIKKCEAFRARQQELFAQVRASNTGNIVPVASLFSFDSKFYSVSERVDTASLSMQEVSSLQDRQKLILLKVLTYSIGSLHRHGVVHADLKPSNVLIKRTTNAYTLKLIDFDASFLESNPKRGEQIRFDFCYVPPEQVAASNDASVSLTCKADIFALGILFHEFWTGVRPAIRAEGCSYICAAVAMEKPVLLHPALPAWMRLLIADMLSLDPGKRPSAAAVLEALTKEAYQPFTMYRPSDVTTDCPNKRKGLHTAYVPKNR